MTQFEKIYFSIERLRLEARLDYLNCQYKQTHIDIYSSLADSCSAQLCLIKKIMDDLDIEFDRKVKV